MKRATRWKAEVLDAFGDVAWDVLAHDEPTRSLASILTHAGFEIRRAQVPSTTGQLPLLYSELDPSESVRAAYEHAGRRDTQLGNALILLIDNQGEWVPRSAVRRVAGDSGDRRVRELRQRNWPIETCQLTGGEAWHVRLALPPARLHLVDLFTA